MGKYPVTQQLWQNVMRMNPSQFKKDKILGLFGGAADPCLPVEQVSWDDCQMFLRKLNNVSGGVSASLPGGSTTDGGRATYILRLPTEAQWEYACRAGTTTRFNTGDGNDDLKRSGWYDNNSRGATQPVGYKEANTWGLCDMHGNVWEWCQDRYSSYSSGPLTDPPGPASGVHRVLRGGSWGHRAEQCRSATRLSFLPSFACSMSGFRVVVNP
jgi:formylglycine-generating enzyme required for sulfatase activity